MKSTRQEKIIEIISKYEVETQDDLIAHLNREGYNVTQATISRDIRELKLVKGMTGKGTYKYIVPGVKRENNAPVLNRRGWLIGNYYNGDASVIRKRESNGGADSQIRVAVFIENVEFL